MTYNITTTQMTGLIILAVWELICKGVALWRAAQRNQSSWFITLLVINSAGILPIAYMVLTGSQQNSDEGGRESSA